VQTSDDVRKKIISPSKGPIPPGTTAIFDFTDIDHFKVVAKSAINNGAAMSSLNNKELSTDSKISASSRSVRLGNDRDLVKATSWLTDDTYDATDISAIVADGMKENRMDSNGSVSRNGNPGVGLSQNARTGSGSGQSGLTPSQGGTWNQFSANSRLFDVTSSFDENLYTTKLDVSKLTPQQIDRANKLASEIETEIGQDFHSKEERGQIISGEHDDLCEEDLYSGVSRHPVSVNRQQIALALSSLGSVPATQQAVPRHEDTHATQAIPRSEGTPAAPQVSPRGGDTHDSVSPKLQAPLSELKSKKKKHKKGKESDNNGHTTVVSPRLHPDAGVNTSEERTVLKFPNVSQEASSSTDTAVKHDINSAKSASDSVAEVKVVGVPVAEVPLTPTVSSKLDVSSPSSTEGLKKLNPNARPFVVSSQAHIHQSLPKRSEQDEDVVAPLSEVSNDMEVIVDDVGDGFVSARSGSVSTAGDVVSGDDDVSEITVDVAHMPSAQGILYSNLSSTSNLHPAVMYVQPNTGSQHPPYPFYATMPGFLPANAGYGIPLRQPQSNPYATMMPGLPNTLPIPYPVPYAHPLGPYSNYLAQQPSFPPPGNSLNSASVQAYLLSRQQMHAEQHYRQLYMSNSHQQPAETETTDHSAEDEVSVSSTASPPHGPQTFLHGTQPQYGFPGSSPPQFYSQPFSAFGAVPVMPFEQMIRTNQQFPHMVPMSQVPSYYPMQLPMAAAPGTVLPHNDFQEQMSSQSNSECAVECPGPFVDPETTRVVSEPSALDSGGNASRQDEIPDIVVHKQKRFVIRHVLFICLTIVYAQKPSST
jgi:hypothetical protein